MANLAKLYNNPLAIIQKKPDQWQGMIGHTSGGFIKFSSIAYGARAGYINLVNTYLSRGRNTIASIIPIYAPKGHGANNPTKYIELLSELTGIAPNEKIKPSQLYKLGLGIARVETGYNPSESDMKKGFDLALERIGIIYTPSSKSGTDDWTIQKKNINTKIALVLVVGIFLALTKLRG